jgi:mannose-1-phosphate guanylyltransferase
MSRSSRPKQLIPFVRGRSLLSLSYGRLKGLVEPDKRLVCAGEAHRDAVFKELPTLPKDRYLGEPEGRDTMAAIGFGAAVIARADPAAVMGVFTADHLIEPEGKFRSIVETGYRIAEESPETLVAFGITPAGPATGYGYLELGEELLHGSRAVSEFKEKPDASTAERYFKAGPVRYLWNSGMYVWRVSTFLSCLKKIHPATFDGLGRVAEAWGAPSFSGVLSAEYPALRKISVDYGIMEPASHDPGMRVAAVPMNLSWTDVGSWSAFAGTVDMDDKRNASAAAKTLFFDSRGTLVVSSDPGHLVAALGCDDLVIVHTPDATLVCRKDRAEDVKKLQAEVSKKFGPPLA